MGDVVQFEDLDADLPKPKWFYKQCEEMAHKAYDQYRELVETCPFGALSIDDLFASLEAIPTRLMAIKEGDEELEQYLLAASVFRAVVARMGTRDSD